MEKEKNVLSKASVSRREFLAGAAATTAALALPFNRQLRPLVHLAPERGAVADDVVTVALYATAAAAKNAEAFLASFTKQFGIKLNIIGIPANSWVGLFQSVSTRLAGGEPLDTAYIATEGMLLFEERGVLDPLNSYIATDQAAVNSFYADLNPHMLANFRQLDNIKGETFFLPIGYNVMSMWINKPVFKEFNIPIPSPGWTWDEFESAATKIADPPNRFGFAIGTPIPGPFTDVYPWVLTNGGAIMNPTQSKSVADNPAAIEAATFVRSLVEKKLVNEPGGAYNAFTEAAGQKLGMFGAGIWPNNGGLPLHQSQINSQFEIIPWPQKTQPATPVGVGGFPMFKSSKAKPALWEFIKWTISEEFQRGPVVSFGGDMPIRNSVATDPSFLKEWPPGTDYFTKELAYSTLIVGVPNAGAVENEISTVWEQIMTGAITPAQGMKTMQDTCNSLMTQKV
jgi:multiple sugar transport system substrate-binding protein